MSKYVCDKCTKEFEFADEIKICPYCGYTSIRDLAKPMKKIMYATCTITAKMCIIKHEDDSVEPLFFINGDKTTEIVGDVEYEKNISNVEYDSCDKYI